MSHHFDYDFFVIGAGSGGTRAARMAATKGIKTAIAEEYRAGGTCVIRGCVPKKLYSYASHFSDEFDIARFYGHDVPNTIPFDWKILQKNKNTEIARLEGIYQNLLKNSGVDFISDSASFVSNHEILLKNGNKIITAKNILIATGGTPRPLKIDNKVVGITSNDIFNLEALPERILIYGSGYIAVEFAGILHGLGVNVTIAYRGDRLLKEFDHDLSDKLTQEYISKGITLIPNTALDTLSLDGNCVTLVHDNQLLKFSTILNTIGRIPNSDTLNLNAIGIKTAENGKIITNENFATNINNIFAIGDVANTVNLTPVAIAEAMCLTQTLFTDTPKIMDYDTIATAVFSNPEIGTVGFSEQQAIEKGYSIKIFESSFRQLKYSVTDKQTRHFMKLIVDNHTDIVLGVHLLGSDSAELIQLMGVIVKAKLTKRQLDDTMAVHPTLAEELVTMRTPSRII
jgi:glutathione reductase (NADPH)